jgi:hypothetical protein
MNWVPCPSTLICYDDRQQPSLLVYLLLVCCHISLDHPATILGVTHHHSPLLPCTCCSQAGTTDVLIDTLPGFPDGVDSAAGGSFWISLVAPVTPFMKLPLLANTWARALVAWLPASIRPKPRGRGLIIKVRGQAGVLFVLLCGRASVHVAATIALAL